MKSLILRTNSLSIVELVIQSNSCDVPFQDGVGQRVGHQLLTFYSKPSYPWYRLQCADRNMGTLSTPVPTCAPEVACPVLQGGAMETAGGPWCVWRVADGSFKELWVLGGETAPLHTTLCLPGWPATNNGLKTEWFQVKWRFFDELWRDWNGKSVQQKQWITDWLTDLLTDWLTDWFTYRLIDGLIWLTDWLIDWLID